MKKWKTLSTVGKNILVVDDNALNCKVLVHYLQQKGHFCYIAENGQEAVQRATAFNYDMIFMDIEMPLLNVTTFY